MDFDMIDGYKNWKKKWTEMTAWILNAFPSIRIQMAIINIQIAKSEKLINQLICCK